MRSKWKQQYRQHGKKMLAVLLAASMGIVFPAPGSLSEAAKQAVGEDEVYGYGTMTMTYAEFYAGDVDNAGMDAVSSATTQKNLTFPNADSTEPTEDGYKICGVKNVPVKVMASAGDELKARVTFNPAETAEPTQYKVVDGNGIGATVYDVKATVGDAVAELNTNSVWGDYEIDITEKSTSYLRNIRSDIKDEATGETFEIGSQVQGLIFETDKGYKVAAAHMENIWVQPCKVAFSPEGNANSNEFKKLVGEKICKITYIMPTATYVYDLGEGVYIKPAYQNKVSGTFNEGRTAFTLNEEISGLTNAKIAISYREGRNTTQLLEATALTGKDYALTTAVPEDKYATVIISSDEYADIVVEYPITSWQKEQLESMVSSAADILTKLDDATLEAHKKEAEALLANEAATAGEANELIGELTGMIDAAIEKLKNPSTPAEPTPTDPAPVEPTPTEPAPTDPEPTAPADTSSIKTKKVTIKSITGTKKKMTVKWKKIAGAEGYQVQYALNKKFSKAGVKNVKSVSKAVITKLTSGKKYYVRVRAYKKESGKKVYSNYSTVKSVTLKK